MDYPKTVKYHKEHAWLKIEGLKGIVGITDFAQSELGEIVFVELPEVGSAFKQNTVFGTIEALKTVSDLFMPVSGKVTAINKRLASEPVLVNNDPFGDGWLIEISIDVPEDAENLLPAEAYLKLTT